MTESSTDKSTVSGKRAFWTRLTPNVKRVRISGTTETAGAFVLSRMAEERSITGLKGPIVVVVPPKENAQHLFENLRFFVDPEISRVLYFPSWNLSPLEPLSPDSKTVGLSLIHI